MMWSCDCGEPGGPYDASEASSLRAALKALGRRMDEPAEGRGEAYRALLAHLDAEGLRTTPEVDADADVDDGSGVRR